MLGNGKNVIPFPHFGKAINMQDALGLVNASVDTTVLRQKEES